MKELFEIVSTEDGEVLGSTFIPVFRRRAKKAGFFPLDQLFVEEICKGKLKTGQDARVLLLLLAKADLNNLVTGPLKGIAEELGIRQSSLSRTLRRLEDAGLILRRGSNLRISIKLGFRSEKPPGTFRDDLTF